MRRGNAREFEPRAAGIAAFGVVAIDIDPISGLSKY
jgi:hypothetical protein